MTHVTHKLNNLEFFSEFDLLAVMDGDFKFRVVAAFGQKHSVWKFKQFVAWYPQDFAIAI